VIARKWNYFIVAFVLSCDSSKAVRCYLFIYLFFTSVFIDLGTEAVAQDDS